MSMTIHIDHTYDLHTFHLPGFRPKDEGVRPSLPSDEFVHEDSPAQGDDYRPCYSPQVHRIHPGPPSPKSFPADLVIVITWPFT